MRDCAFLSESEFIGLGGFSGFSPPNSRFPGENARRKNPENPIIQRILILTKGADTLTLALSHQGRGDLSVAIRAWFAVAKLAALSGFPLSRE